MPSSPRFGLALLALLASPLAAQDVQSLGDLNQRPGVDTGSAPGDFRLLPGKAPPRALFTAETLARGRELYVTDGSAAGTSLVRELRSGPDDGAPEQFVSLGGVVFFLADDGLVGRELWRTDGTAAGTQLAIDFAPGAASSAISALAVSQGRLWVLDGSELWVGDGTPAGMQRLQNPALPPRFRITGSWLVATPKGVYFLADDTVHGEELWFSDGRASGTRIAADLETGAASLSIVGPLLSHGEGLVLVREDKNSAPARLRLVHVDASRALAHELQRPNASQDDLVFDALHSCAGQIYAVARRPAWTQARVFASDGSAQSLVLLDATPSGRPEAPAAFFTFGQRAWFAAEETVRGRQWWSSDGTPQGTRIEFDLPVSYAGYELRTPRPIGTRFVFELRPHAGIPELWVHAGSPATAERILPVGRDALGPDLDQGSVLLGAQLLTSMHDLERGREPWLCDGTAAGTQLLANLQTPTGTASSQPAHLVEHDGRAWLQADDGIHGMELWTSDGTPQGTRLFLDLEPGPASSDARPLLSALGRLWFVRERGNGPGELWSTDGTVQGTAVVQDLTTGTKGLRPSRVVAFGDLVLFHGLSPTLGWDFFAVDASGTRVRSLRTILRNVPSSIDPFDWVHSGSRLYLWTEPPTGDPELLYWEHGSNELVAPPYSPAPSPPLYDFHGLLLFVGKDSSSPSSLWGLREQYQGPVRLIPDVLVYGYCTAGSRCFVVTGQGASRFPAAIWVTDGTAAGSMKVFGPSDEDPELVLLGALGNRLVFGAENSTKYRGLWISDGTAAGTQRLVAHRVPLGQAGASVRDGELWFVCDDGQSGLELWRSDGTAKGTVFVRDLAPGSASSQARILGLAAGRLFVAADAPASGRELFASDLRAGRHARGSGFGTSSAWLQSEAPVLGRTVHVDVRGAPIGELGVFLLGGGRTLHLDGAAVTLEVDLAQLAILYAFAIPQADVPLTVPVPNATPLLGLRLAAQCLFVAPQGHLQATAGLQWLLGR